MSDIYFDQSTVAEELRNDINIHAADIDNDGDRDILGSSLYRIASATSTVTS